MRHPATTDVAGVVLAGGRGLRMGAGDKCLQPLGGRPLLSHVLERIRPQVTALALNANGDPARFADWKLPVVADPVDGFAGPLAGLLAGLDWAAALSPPVKWLATVPGDAPFLPVDLVARLAAAQAREGAEMACAASGGQRHHVVALWPLPMREALRHALVDEGLRKVEHWVDRHRVAVVDFSDAPRDPFFNVNTKDDLRAAERMLAARPTGR